MHPDKLRQRGGGEVRALLTIARYQRQRFANPGLHWTAARAARVVCARGSITYKYNLPRVLL
jgi:hypothetical protein